MGEGLIRDTLLKGDGDPCRSSDAGQEEGLGSSSWPASTCVLLWQRPSRFPGLTPPHPHQGVCPLSPRAVWNTSWQSPEEGWSRAGWTPCLPQCHVLCDSFSSLSFPSSSWKGDASMLSVPDPSFPSSHAH